MNREERHQFLNEIAARVGMDSVIRDEAEIERFLRDNSWLSPILTEHIEQMKDTSGQNLRVDAVVSPNSITQLRDVIALSFRHDVPMTLRGGGTTNFGQTIPLKGGLIVDIRRLNRILSITDNSVTTEPGTLQVDANKAARAQGKELTVLTTTYASSTMAGWVAGGHVGLGTSMYGTIWDGNVLEVRMLTAEDPPRELTLRGDDLQFVLHTFGTTGVIIEVTFPLVAAREWLEAVVAFDAFEDAARFTTALAQDTSIPQRVVAAQEPPIPLGFTPLKEFFREGQSAVLMIFDTAKESIVRNLAKNFGGEFYFWKKSDDPRTVPLAYMVYGHRMLWVKKLAPQAAFLHCYLKPTEALDQLQSIKKRFGADVWIELKYMRSRWLRELRGLPGGGILPAPVLTLVPGYKAFIETVMAHCNTIGVTYQNPHTFVLEESGMFPDFNRIVDFKRKTDPKDLLNPGKIGAKFFARKEAVR